MGDNRALLSGYVKKFMGIMMEAVYVRMGWIKLKKFYELTGTSEAAVKQRTMLPTYPEWRVGAGMIKELRDGYYINYERHQEWVEKQPVRPSAAA